MQSDALTPERIAEIRERRERATLCDYWCTVDGEGEPGTVDLVGIMESGGVTLGEIFDYTENAVADAAFVAHAYLDVPDLLAHIDSQAATIAALREALDRIGYAPEGGCGPDLLECIRIARAALSPLCGTESS